MIEVFALLLAYQIKHWVCDFPLQTEYMLGKFKEKGWALPLATHAWIHFLGTYLIASVFTGNSILAGKLALFDFVVHFTMDRIKASPKLLGRFEALSRRDYEGLMDVEKTEGHDPRWPIFKAEVMRSNKLFWWALGFDQMVHHLTHYAIIYALIRYT